MKDVSFKGLSFEDSSKLEIPFSDMENKTTAWDCEVSKSPGSDSYNFYFIGKHWDFLKVDIIKFVTKFHGKAKLNKYITSYFLTVVPKCSHPQGLQDFRPICLIVCLQKIISKILAARIKRVMASLISMNQTMFVPGRSLLDGVLVANEIMDLMTRSKKSCLLFKIDLEKAYDRVSWNFLRFIMKKMGFRER